MNDDPLAPLSPGTLFSLLRRSRYVQLLLALTLISAFLRFYNLGFNSLWLDEASTYTISKGSFLEIWQVTAGGEFNPPLFYWTEHIMLMFGNSEVILRLIPALLGVFTIPLVYFIGKEFLDRNTGIIAAAFCTFSPFLIFFSQEARAYSMMLFFIAFAMVFYLKALKTNDIKHWAIFGFLSALAFWSHFYALVMIGSLVLYGLYELVPKIRKDISTVRPIAAGGVVFGLICLPLIIIMIQLFAKRTASAPTFGIQGLGIITETFIQISGFSERFYYFSFLPLMILFFLGIYQAFSLDKNKGIFLVSITVLTFLISDFLSYRIPMLPRYLIFLTIIFFLGVALSYRLFWTLSNSKAIVYGFIVFAFIISAPALVTYYSGYSKEDWRGFSGQISQLTRPGDLVVVAPGYIYQPFDFYYTNSTDGTIEFHADTARDFDAIHLQKGNNTMYIVVTSDIVSANPNGDAVAWIQGHTHSVTQNTGIYLFASS
ncbi:MAG: glycosyltransferase family 39 protein [Methanoregula sp.]|nr:MAG: glycosyltransferase family 39 protein [Methanoregula sp.]